MWSRDWTRRDAETHTPRSDREVREQRGCAPARGLRPRRRREGWADGLDCPSRLGGPKPRGAAEPRPRRAPDQPHRPRPAGGGGRGAREACASDRRACSGRFITGTGDVPRPPRASVRVHVPAPRDPDHTSALWSTASDPPTASARRDRRWRSDRQRSEQRTRAGAGRAAGSAGATGKRPARVPRRAAREQSGFVLLPPGSRCSPSSRPSHRCGAAVQGSWPLGPVVSRPRRSRRARGRRDRADPFDSVAVAR